MLSLVSWCFVLHLSLNIRWHVGVFLKNWSAFSAMVRLSEETISSSATALVVIYGGLLWQLVSSLILLFVGMKLWIGLENRFVERPFSRS
jgi:hypothetical protein